MILGERLTLRVGRALVDRVGREVHTSGDDEPSKVIESRQSVTYGNEFMILHESGDVVIPVLDSTGGSEGIQLPRFPDCPGEANHSVALDRPSPSKVLSSWYPGLADIYNRVRLSGKPNYRGSRIAVHSGLIIEAWRRRSHLIKDKSLVDMLEFAFPVGFTGDRKPAEGLPNHGSAVRFPDSIEQFLEKEVRLQAMMGPFKDKPFVGWDRVNPLMTRPKRGSDERRVILDLSYPLGESVNAAIPANELDSAPFKMRLPNPWNLARDILEGGPGTRLFKVDLSRAYRQLRTCPLDWPLLTVRWGGMRRMCMSQFLLGCGMAPRPVKGHLRQWQRWCQQRLGRRHIHI